MEALNDCPASIFPAVNLGLRILLTCPATSCTAERSFSCMKRIKTPIRNSLGEKRLNFSTCISCNKDVPFAWEEVARRFEGLKKRRGFVENY